MPDLLHDQLQMSLGAAYTLERELGGGGMARVFVAREEALGRRVVVKVLPPELHGAVSAERFRREIQVAARLRHPNIVAVHAAGESGGLLYYTMPFVDGESLRALLAREGALPITHVVRLLREVADALACAHAEGVVHRDLKPENILLERGHAEVADFGIARALSNATLGVADDVGRARGGALTSVGIAVGTPAYMAPEQALADPAADHRVDLYALGCIAYEALAGAPLFGTLTPQAVIAAHITRAPTPLSERRSDAPPALAALVMRLLEKRPEDRPQSASDVVRALDALDLRTSDSTAATSPARRSRRRLAVLVTAAIVIVGATAGAFAWRMAGRPATPVTRNPHALGASVAIVSPVQAAITSVAVLPLVNVGGDTAQEYFADGMTDEITGALGRVAGLRVASRTSAFAFKGQRNADVRDIGRRLNVDAVLEGTVRRAGGRLKVSAQLTSVNDGLALWSDGYERRMADVFAVQDDIARSIRTALERRLGAHGLGTVTPTRPHDIQAYDLFLRGEFYRRKNTEPDLRRSIASYQAALARDSTLARAWLGISEDWAWLADDWLPPREAYPKASAAALRALAVDPTLADARSAYGVVLTLYDWNFAAAEREIRSAVALDSAQGAFYDLADLLSVTGRLNESITEMRVAKQLNPLDPQVATALGDKLMYAGRYREAMAEYREALELEPDYGFALTGMGEALTAQGHAAEAVQVLRRASGFGTRQQITLGRAYAALGRRGEAESIAHALELEYDSGRHYVRADGIASIYAALGDGDTAFRWLDRAVLDRSSGLIYLRVRPWWKPLRSDPRFTELVRRVGLPGG